MKFEGQLSWRFLLVYAWGVELFWSIAFLNFSWIFKQDEIVLSALVSEILPCKGHLCLAKE